VRVAWSSGAEKDLLQIWNYLAREASIENANRQIEKIRQLSRLLSEQPQAGRLRNSLIRGIRSIATPPYVLFYRLSDDAVQIVRVVHGKRDIEAILRDAP